MNDRNSKTDYAERAGKGRIPDYSVALIDRSSGKKNGNVGGAWANEDGSISVRINNFIVLPTSPDLIITLFPIKPRTEEPAPETEQTPIDQNL